MLVDTAQFPVRRIGPGEALDAKRTALVVVDMINRFCDPEWLGRGVEDAAGYYRAALGAAIPRIARVLECFRAQEALVVHVVVGRWTHDGREVVPYARGRDYDLFDTPAMSVIPELAPVPGEIVVRKVASSGFTGTGLEYLLRNAGVRNVVISGQYGNACCFYSLIDSREAGFDNYWLEDGLVYTGDAYRHVIQALVGSMWAKLATAEEVAAALEA